MKDWYRESKSAGTGSTCSPTYSPANLGVKMDDEIAAKIKSVYDKYYAGEISSEEAMHKLELIINEVEDDDE
jgi:hypothetical protein